MKKIKVSLGKRSYDILVGRGVINEAGRLIKKLRIGNDALIVTSANISRRYGKILKDSLLKSGMSVQSELVPDSEKAKSSAILIRLLNNIALYDRKRSLFIIALGGGVVGDLAGFVASIYKRGIPYVQIPTTLLAQVDSAIGGKVAIDLPMAKNLAGSFYQPKVVISDVDVLKSLSPRQIKNGLAECIKYGAIKDRLLFEYLEKNYRRLLKSEPAALERVISACARIKADVVGEDELDNRGKRVILNFGHTMGHAIEAASGYSKGYHHGEAIAIGMIIASRISLRLGLIKKSDCDRIESIIKRVGLPVKIKGLKFSSIYDAHFHDKKFSHGKNRFVLPVSIGKVRVVENVPAPVITGTIKENMR